MREPVSVLVVSSEMRSLLIHMTWAHCTCRGLEGVNSLDAFPSRGYIQSRLLVAVFISNA